MISKYRHIGIVVNDMERSINFYCNLLGHKIIIDFIEKGDYFSKLVGLKNSEARVVKANAPDGIYIELIQFLTHPSIEPKGNEYNIRGRVHICYTVEDIDQIYERLSSNNVEFISPPLESPFDPVKTCFCYDPDNTIIQFVEITDSSLIRDGLK